MQGYSDLGDLPEDDRITVIGNTVMNAPRTSGDKPFIAALMLEDDAKADRYIQKLQAQFPGIRIIDRLPGLVPGTIAVRIGQPLR